MNRMITAALLGLILAACTVPADAGLPAQTSAIPVSESSEPAAILTGKVMEADENGLLLAGENAGELYHVGLPQQGIKPGQTVEIGYSGAMQETYPASPADPVSVKLMEEGDDLVGFYRRMIDDLWNTDEGLNPSEGTLAFDLSKVSNLSAGEKDALIWLAANDYGMEGIAATFDELCEQGYIDREHLDFKNGIHIRIEVAEPGSDRFTFHAEKWRSGLGAYFFYNCKAVQGADGWSYTIGEEMIS